MLRRPRNLVRLRSWNCRALARPLFLHRRQPSMKVIVESYLLCHVGGGLSHGLGVQL
jgi:hypothetical protein